MEMWLWTFKIQQVNLPRQHPKPATWDHQRKIPGKITLRNVEHMLHSRHYRDTLACRMEARVTSTSGDLKDAFCRYEVPRIVEGRLDKPCPHLTEEKRYSTYTILHTLNE